MSKTYYTKSTDFASKDTLPKGNPLKVVKGAEFDQEFNNLATALNSASNDISAAIIGNSITAELRMFAGSVAPSGWLMCDGSALSRNAYANLFNAIGTAFGTGDGTTTFNLPDMRGRVPVGAGQGTNLTNHNLGDKGGEEKHTLTTAEMPAHNHSINIHDPGHSHGVYGGSSGSYQPGGPYGASGGQNGQASGNTASAGTGITADSSNTGSGTAHNIMQPYTAVNYIIKT